MKTLLLSLLAWAVAISAGIFFILMFAFSDYIDIFLGDSSILVAKPWRPVSRVIFGGVVLPIYLVFVGWFVTALYRDRSRQRIRESHTKVRKPKTAEHDEGGKASPATS